MTNNRLFLDIHVIQTLPPSNINRDDTGSPKTAQYGGVRRARVSSQSWKRAMRKFFHENSEEANVGVRTLEVVRYVAEKINQLDSSMSNEDAMNMADKVLKDSGVKTKDQRARALFFIGNSQAEKLANAAINGVTDKKELQAILKDNPAIDIALFGRMVADDATLNEDASSQVAHAISTHAVQTEFDFYTAVDDHSQGEHAGAGMLGTLEYNSSTLYRYANIAVHELVQQIDNQAAVANTLQLFIDSFVKSMPTGKINSYANQTLPHAVIVSLRTDRPVSLVTAFENPIKASDGHAEASIKALFKEMKRIERLIDAPEVVYSLDLEGIDADYKSNVIEEESLKSLLSDIDLKVTELLDKIGE